MDRFIKKMRRLICLPIVLYQWIISPYLPAACRFYPSCSHYAIDAIQHYGVVKGIWKTILRLLKCHPWSQGGFDPVCFEKEVK